jgi:hypothetical protein
MGMNGYSIHGGDKYGKRAKEKWHMFFIAGQKTIGRTGDAWLLP